MSQPVWSTPAGSLGTIPEGVFYSLPLLATADSTVYYQLIAGALPKGMQINETGLLAGIPNARAQLEGVPANVPVDTVSKFAIRAFTRAGGRVAQLADRTFTLEVANTNLPAFVTPAGLIDETYDGILITDLQVEYTGPVNTVMSLISGSLPPGLTVSPTGVISGLISSIPTTTNYTFTLQITDGTVAGTALRAFTIRVWSRSWLSADDTYITADNIFITADGTPVLIPVLMDTPGSIGTVRCNDYFAYAFNGVSPSGAAFRYLIDTYLPGLTLDPNSGYLYGTIPTLFTNQETYPFNIRLQLVDQPDYISPPYAYALTVIGPVISDITWITPSFLGSIDNGAASTFLVSAATRDNKTLRYQLLLGSASRLPQGLQLLTSGEIVGRVSFDTFAVDGGSTAFDSNTTTFDLVSYFTVEAVSVDGTITSSKTFSIGVNRTYNEPYDNLYIQAMPPVLDRAVINNLLQNSDIFQQNLIYRPDDANFGVAKNVKYYHAYGLAPAELASYVASLDINHYWKNITLGPIKVAQAIDSSGNVIYDVVYSEIMDDLVNNVGVSVGKQVTLPYTVRVGGSEIKKVYPNSLVNMRNQVIDTVGQISNTLPLWMTSKQANGQTLGFVPAWVIAYAQPGRGQQIAYYIGEDFIHRLNAIDFEVDRYELDNLLTHNWNREAQHWGYAGDALTPYPPSLTTFDMSRELATWINDKGELTTWADQLDTLATWTYGTPPGTTFDGGSLQFTAPVDMYSTTNEYDKYLVFPRRNILG